MSAVKVEKVWCEVPAWWIPVWIALPRAADASDPLEDAAHELIKVGRATPGEISDLLCLDRTLVESAVALLAQRGKIQVGEDGRWRSIESVSEVQRPVERAGWIAWDNLAQRPLLEVWLGKPPNQYAIYTPDEWSHVPNARVEHVASPPGKDVNDALRALSRMPDIAAYEIFGDGWRAIDLGVSRRIRENAMKRRRLLTIHVPVEFRATNPTVWRPSMVPLRMVRSELDPTGWDGLMTRVAGAPRRALEGHRLESTNALQPLLAEHGFEKVEDLVDYGRRDARRALLGSWDSPGWDQLQQDVVNAVVDGRIAAITAPQRGWRQVLHGWCDVLDNATAAIVTCQGLSDAAVRRLRTIPPDDRRAAVARHQVLGPSGRHLRNVVGNDEQLGQLEHKMRHGLTIGQRALAIALAYVFDAPARVLLEPALQECRSFFDELDKAVDARNQIVHPRDQASELIDASTFRDRVLGIVRATMRIPRAA